jgi:hypothetical protein
VSGCIPWCSHPPGCFPCLCPRLIRPRTALRRPLAYGQPPCPSPRVPALTRLRPSPSPPSQPPSAPSPQPRLVRTLLTVHQTPPADLPTRAVHRPPRRRPPQATRRQIPTSRAPLTVRPPPVHAPTAVRLDPPGDRPRPQGSTCRPPSRPPYCATLPSQQLAAPASRTDLPGEKRTITLKYKGNAEIRPPTAGT